MKPTRAEVVKLVDAVDSKSTGLIARAGSIPAFGTIICKEHVGKIAIRQYSMIYTAIRETLLFCANFCVLAILLIDTQGSLFSLLKHQIKPEPVEV